MEVSGLKMDPILKMMCRWAELRSVLQMTPPESLPRMQSASIRSRIMPESLHSLERTVIKSSHLCVRQCARCEANVGTNTVARSAGDGESASNKKAIVIGHLTTGYNDDSAQDLPRKKLKEGYRGPSPNVNTLISSLLENKASTAGNPTKMFRCFLMLGRPHGDMDLFEIAFKDNCITFVRMDGTMTRTQINRVKEDFERSAEISVIRISIMAGVSAFYRACIMEPQFIPDAGSRGIDRRKSAELQKKTELANVSMSPRSLRGKNAMEKLEDLRTLFR
ncbi:hypothetical protein B9Z19DRAFT_1120402 [Tuber borchii]|uniref:Uncharacterized protein n=1 Tax=Tuber borchii TaxID=42251 RepID=A0A2T7A4G8_TUBBO|nr:hypothetical protein B9Z19DRAFT_1120402 [Tuber borchii]